MLRWAAGALLLLAGGAEPSPLEPPSQRPSGDQYAQLVVREQIVVRVQPRRVPVQPVAWKEGKGVKCVPARAIAAATMPGKDSVDLIMRDARRVRAKLDSSCPALDYYYGFYIRPNADGMICADRDAIRSRIGGQCDIDRFRTLEAVARK